MSAQLQTVAQAIREADALLEDVPQLVQNAWCADGKGSQAEALMHVWTQVNLAVYELSRATAALDAAQEEAVTPAAAHHARHGETAGQRPGLEGEAAVSTRKNSEVLEDLEDIIGGARRKAFELWDGLEQNADLAEAFMVGLSRLQDAERQVFMVREAELCAEGRVSS